MPELPEVETVVRDLRPLLVGCRIANVRSGERALRRPWKADWAGKIQGRTLVALDRRGKWIVARFDDGQLLVIHLGMTGQLTVGNATEPLPDHVHLLFDLDDGRRQLRFRDVRRFGSATLYPSDEELQAAFEHAGLGPEPFDLDAKAWGTRLRGAKRCLKAVLLDQRVVAGVGNIYADEALFAAKLHPGQCARDLTPKAAARLGKAVVEVLRNAIERRGSTIRDYIGGSGLRGGYQNEFRAYGRTGEPCPRCRTPIACVRLAGRSSHFCPHCQVEDVGHGAPQTGA